MYNVVSTGKILQKNITYWYFEQLASTMRHCDFFCSSGVDIDRVVRDAKRIFCNTPRTASMRRHDRLFADPNVKHVSQNHRPLFHGEEFVKCQTRA